MKDWFTVDKIDENTYIISEYHHPEETHCYLLNGENKSLLIDTGLGIFNIYEEVTKLTDKPIAAIATHIHWDHIGGHKYFPEFYVHEYEANWINGDFPLTNEEVRNMLMKKFDPPKGFKIKDYTVFQGKPSNILTDNYIIDLGGRIIEVLHTPGHSPGHICFWEKEKGYLFTGDLVYKGILSANFYTTNPDDYLDSLKRIAELPVKKVFPAHHSLEIEPEIIIRMRDTFQELQENELLFHGNGTFFFSDWGLSL